MAKQSVKAAPNEAHHDGECGAVEGLTPLDRVNRVHLMLDGLSALQTIFDSAVRAPEEHQSTPQVWGPAFYLTRMITTDIFHEVSAIHDAMRAGAKA